MHSQRRSSFNLMATLAISLLQLVSITGVFAQAEGSVFSATGRAAATSSVTDYQSVGINPANLGIPQDYKWAFGLADGAFSIWSDALLSSELREMLFNFNDFSFPDVQKEVFSQKFIERGMAMNLDLTALGVYGYSEDLGGVGFSTRLRASDYFRLNEFGSEVIFEGFNFDKYFDTLVVIFGDTTGVSSTPEKLSELFDGTRMDYSLMAEFNLSWGRELVRTNQSIVYGGIGLKYLMGFQYFQFRANGKELDGFSSLSPGFLFELDSLDTPSQLTTDNFQKVGDGFGLDLGINIQVGDHSWFAASLTDLGIMTWKGNVVEFNDYLLDSLAYGGINTVNLLTELDAFIAEQLLITTGVEKRTTSLPTQFRAGAHILATDLLMLGMDVVIPMNREAGNLAFPELGIGMEYCFFDVLFASGGAVVGGNYDLRVPLGLSLKFPHYEMGAASRDMLSWFGAKEPTLSLAVGFLRFKFD